MAAKRCPMCHRVSGRTEQRCACGYVFGQDVETVVGLLRDQQKSTRIALGVLLAADATAAAGVVLGSIYGFWLVPMVAFGALVVRTARTVQQLSITRTSLRQLTRRELPKATLIKG